MSYPQQYGGIVPEQAAPNQPGHAGHASTPPRAAAAGPQFSPQDEELLAELEQRRYAASQAAVAQARAQAAASAPAPGTVVVYRYHDTYADPARDRDQLV